MTHTCVGVAATLLFVTAVFAANPSNEPSRDGVPVGGSLATPEGDAVANARVFLLRRGQYVGDITPREIRGGADGTFVFDGVAAGEYRVWAVAGNLASRDKVLQGEVIKVPKAGEGEPPAPRLVMRPGRVLKATIKSAADGKPIAGAQLRVRPTDLEPNFVSDAAGAVTIEALTPETLQFHATAPGKAKVMKQVDLGSAEENVVEFALPEGGTVRGKVTDAGGNPVAGVGINIYPENDGTPTDFVKTEKDGSYRLDNVEIDKPQRVLFNHDGLESKWERGVTLTAAQRERELNVSLTPGKKVAIVGTVTDGNDVPIADARVSHEDGRGKVAKTDAKGAFRLEVAATRKGARVPDQVTVRAKGWAPRVLSVDVDASGAPVPMTIQLTEPGHRIKARVLDEEGKPVRGAWVTAGVDGAHNDTGGRMTTGDDGKFEFDSLPADAQFDISAQGYDSLDFKKLTLDGDGVVDVVLRRPPVVRGRVVDADTGKPIPRFSIRHYSSDQGKEFGAASGEFRLTDLTEYEQESPLIVSADGYPTQYFDDVLPGAGAAANATPPIELRLSKKPAGFIRLAGKIVDAEGKPLKGVEVRAVVYSNKAAEHRRLGGFRWSMLKSGQLAIQRYVRTVEQTRTAADGSFEFPGLPGDEADLAYWGEGVPQTRVADVGKRSAEEREKLELRLPPPTSLGGRINREAFPEIAHLTLYDSGDASNEIEVPIKDKQDSYKIPDLPPGAYALYVAAPAERHEDGTFHFPYAAAFSVNVAAGEAKTLDLGFEPGHAVSGRVTVGGKPLARANVYLFFEAHPRDVHRTAKTDAEGRYRFTHVPPGKYGMLVSPGDKPLDTLTARRSKDRKMVDVKDADVEQELELGDARGL